MEQQEGEGGDGLVLVVRKSAHGLPTACPVCLPAYIYLRLANISFNTHYNLVNPDSGKLLLHSSHYSSQHNQILGP
jgi:metaxin